MKIRMVQGIARQYVGGWLQMGSDKPLRKIVSVVYQPHKNAGDDTLVTTDDGTVVLFDRDDRGILLDNGMFVGEDDRFRFIPPTP